ncbi:lytic murein transglycosylase B [Immundisolibacter sp.]|uniref:lytic murein transglycosylase B n=1 Tax=Immundisolibacter sp. TaxID=1934948 RepID=UPI003563D64A
MSRLLGLLLATALTAPASAMSLADHPPLRELVDRLVQKDGFDRASVERTLAAASYQQSIVDAISRPAEKMPWHRYRPIFLTQQRIDGGVEFWQQHAELLARAERDFGVPAAVITAIIGVETRYGAITGRYKALDALATLAVAGLSRSGFFAGELRELLLLGRDEHLDPLTLTSSYAGALGLPQFIPSSYRAYAIDFDQDGRRDLLSSPADAIGSVANYLHRHGWQPGQAISARATVTPAGAALANGDLLPRHTLEALRQGGVSVLGDDFEVQPNGPASATPLNAALIRFDGDAGDEYHLGFRNFYAITRYNHSALYALAVTQLAAAIDAQHGATP